MENVVGEQGVALRGASNLTILIFMTFFHFCHLLSYATILLSYATIIFMKSRSGNRLAAKGL